MPPLLPPLLPPQPGGSLAAAGMAGYSAVEGAHRISASPSDTSGEAKAPKCELRLWSDGPHIWYRYEPTQVDINKETKEPTMPDDFRPVFGTYKEPIEGFIEGCIAKPTTCEAR